MLMIPSFGCASSLRLASRLHFKALPRRLVGKSARLVDIDEGLAADLIVMLVDHDEFRQIPADRVAGKALVDTRGVWTQAKSLDRPLRASPAKR